MKAGRLPRYPNWPFMSNPFCGRSVDHFFDSTGDDQVYVAREDKDGNSFVQFGDGKTGMRLPSGKNNVKAVYRTGDRRCRSPGSRGQTQGGGEAQGTGRCLHACTGGWRR